MTGRAHEESYRLIVDWNRKPVPISETLLKSEFLMRATFGFTKLVFKRELQREVSCCLED